MENIKDLEWEKEHFVSQIKGDYAEPSRCPRCTGNNLNRTNEGRIWWKGWICSECQNIVDGCSFYQGRNNGRMQQIKEEIDFLKIILKSNDGRTDCLIHMVNGRLELLNKMKEAIFHPMENHEIKQSAKLE